MHSSTYLLLGVRGDAAVRRWDLDGSLTYGNGFEDQAGQWFWADATIARPWARSSTVRVATTFSGLRYISPFDYGAFTAQLWPSFLFRAKSLSLTLTPQLTAGGWQADSVSGSIAVYGSSVTLAHTAAQTTVQFTAEAHHTAAGALQGSFGGAGLDAATTVHGFDLGAGVRRWQTPLEAEWGYNAFVSRTLAPNAQVYVQVARSVTDAVLATPGSLGASLTLSWRLAARGQANGQTVASVGTRAPEGRKVRFTVEVPDATKVAVSGSFTDWNPIVMRRRGKTFSIELLVPTGTHQYGFLIDGKTWYLPADANGIVDDGFGRKNATLVVD